MLNVQKIFRKLSRSIRVSKIVFVVFLLVLASACTSINVDPEYEFKPLSLEENQAAIYIYGASKSSEALSTVLIELLLDGVRAGAIRPGYHYKKAISPGVHSLALSAGPYSLFGFHNGKITFEAKSGESYYYRCTSTMTGSNTYRITVIPVPKEIGEVEIVKTVPLTNWDERQLSILKAPGQR